VTFSQHDNIIVWPRAALYSALKREAARGKCAAADDLASKAAGRWQVLELRTANRDWLPHDMPLFLDDQWSTVLTLIAHALGDGVIGVGGDDEKQPSLAGRARAIFVRPGVTEPEVGEGAYTRML